MSPRTAVGAMLQELASLGIFEVRTERLTNSSSTTTLSDVPRTHRSMDHERLRAAVPEGETLRYAGPLRRGHSVGLTDERLLAITGNDEAVSVEFRNVAAVELQDLDWFLVVLSFLLVGFGAVSTTRNVLAGVAFVGAGVASLAVTYHKRHRATVKTHSRPKPLELYPSDSSEFYDAFQRALDGYESPEPDEPPSRPDPPSGPKT
jgi:hypothetical protein